MLASQLPSSLPIRWKAGKPGGWNAGKLEVSKDLRLYSFPASKHQAFEYEL
jgi:hypothetical protein